MSKTDSGAANVQEYGEGGRSPTVADPDNYNLTRRFKQIHDARERFPEVKREEGKRVTKEANQGGILEGRYRELVANALIDYLVEVEPIMRNDELEDGEVYWEDTIVATDPAGNEITLARIVDQNGYVADGNGGQVPLPITLATSAYRLANRFLADAGLGLEVDQGLPVEESFDSTDVDGDGQEDQNDQEENKTNGDG